MRIEYLVDETVFWRRAYLALLYFPSTHEPLHTLFGDASAACCPERHIGIIGVGPNVFAYEMKQAHLSLESMAGMTEVG
jgi:hypothetical protein